MLYSQKQLLLKFLDRTNSRVFFRTIFQNNYSVDQQCTAISGPLTIVNEKSNKQKHFILWIQKQPPEVFYVKR